MRMLRIAVVCIGAGVAAGCTNAQGIEVKAARPVKTEVVAVAPAPAGIRYSAGIEAFEQVSLAFKAAGYVDDLLRRNGADGRSRVAQAGDLVTRGTVLARVREADYRERVEQGRARLAEGEAGLKKARLDLERANILYAADSLTKPDLDAAQSAYDSAQARVVATQGDIQLALIALRDCALVTPATGVLLERRIEVGSLVSAGSVGFVFGDVSAVKARFGIPDSVIQSVKPGETIGVTVEAAAATTFSGKVTAVAPAADPRSRVFDVEVTIPNTDGRLRPGMIGTVVIGGSMQAPSALTLPLSAVVRAPGESHQYAVLVVDRHGSVETARVRKVDLGDVIGNGVAVLKGVAAGDRVITTGATLLTDGDAVRVIP